MKKLLLLLIFFPLLSFAQEEWEYVGSSTDKSEFYIKDAEKKVTEIEFCFGAKQFCQIKQLKQKKAQ